MNVQVELLKTQTTGQRVKTVDYILNNPLYFQDLMSIFLANDYRLQQRSAWIVCHVAIQKPALLLPYYQQIIRKLKNATIPDAFKRNVVRVWQDVDLPQEHLGEIYNCCFDFLKGKEAIAIKAFSMTVCYTISNQFPELKPELLSLIEDVLRKDGVQSKGILSRGNKTLKLLKRDLRIK